MFKVPKLFWISYVIEDLAGGETLKKKGSLRYAQAN